MKHTMKRIFILQIILFLGHEWINAGWTPTYGPGGGHIYSLTKNDKMIFAGTNAGIFQSSNKGQNWSRIQLGVHGDISVYSIAASNLTLLAGTDKGVFISKDNGNNWKVMDSGMTKYSGRSGFVEIVNNNMFASGSEGIYRLSKEGNYWEKLNIRLTGNPIISFKVIGSYILAGTFRGLHRSSDNGQNWTKIANGLPNDCRIHAFAKIGRNLFAGTLNDGIFLSADSGATWVKKNEMYGVNSLTVDDNLLFAGDPNGHGGVFVSYDFGSKFKHVGQLQSVTTCLASDGSLYAGTEYDGVYRLNAADSLFVKINTGLTAGVIKTIAAGETELFAGLPGGVFHYSKKQNIWTEIDGFSATALITLGNTIVFNHVYHGAYFSNDNGLNWKSATDGLPKSPQQHYGFPYQPYYHVYCFEKRNNELFAGTNNGIYMTKDLAGSWEALNRGIVDIIVRTIATNNTHLFIGTFRNGIFSSSDNGLNWENINTGLPDSIPIVSIEISGNSVFALLETGKIYISRNYGANWMISDSGLIDNAKTNTLIKIHNNILAGTDNGVFQYAADNQSWKSINQGLPEYASVHSLSSNNFNIYAGTAIDGVWKLPVSEVFGLEELRKYDFPQKRLAIKKQNNNSLNISFSLTTPEYVSLDIYTLTGSKITNLADKHFFPGKYNINWDTKHIPTDCYVVIMEIGAEFLPKLIPIIR